MNENVVGFRGRQVMHEGHKCLACIQGREKAELCPNEHQVTVEAVFAHDVDMTVLRKRRRKIRPCLAIVGGLINMRPVVAGMMTDL